MLKERVLSALVLAPLAALAFYTGGIGFLALTTVLAGCSAEEFRRMLKGTGFDLGFLFVPVSTVIALSGSFNRVDLFLSSIIIGCLVLLSVSLKRGMPPAAFSVAGAVYIGGLFGVLGFLRSGPGGREWAFLVLFTTWATDVGAYFGGRAFGRHKIAPKISPGKSWEGAAFGMCSCMIISALWGRYMGLPLYFSIFSGMFIGVMAGIGDLVESAFKRYCKVKDSGRAIPGHGGFLDRFDSLLFAGVAGVLLQGLSKLLFDF